MAAEPDDLDAPVPCPECQAGTLDPRPVTLAQWFDGRFVLVPDFPGWVCDFCGRCEYDAEGLARLELMLGSPAEPRRPKPRPAQRGPATHLSAWRSGRRSRV